MTTPPAPTPDWQPLAVFACPYLVAVSGQPCGHPVEFCLWPSADGVYVQFRCLGGGHAWVADLALLAPGEAAGE